MSSLGIALALGAAFIFGVRVGFSLARRWAEKPTKKVTRGAP